MRFNPLIIFTIGGMLITAPAVADEPTQPQAQQVQPAPKAAPAKLICRMETEIGSLSKKRRVCRAARQRAPASEASRDAGTPGEAADSSSAK